MLVNQEIMQEEQGVYKQLGISEENSQKGLASLENMEVN